MTRSSDPTSQPRAAGTVDAVLAAIDADVPPKRLLLGSLAFDLVLPACEQRMSVWRDWEITSRSADAA
jgi:hypothetical protein